MKKNLIDMEDRKQNPRVEDIIINTTFIMADAIDILIRDAERRMRMNNENLSHRYKLMHSNLLRCLRDTRLALERYNKFCDDYLTWQDRDNQRRDSNFICRIMLLIADRTADGNTLVEQQIEDFITSLQDKGKVSEDIIKEFVLR